MHIRRAERVYLPARLVLLLVLITTACSSVSEVEEEIDITNASSPNFTYLLDRAYFENNYDLLRYVLYQRVFQVNEANPLAEILEQNIIFTDSHGHRISIDQYIDRYTETPSGNPVSDYRVPIRMTEYFPLDIETRNLAVFSTICCSEAGQTTCQLIATHDRFVIHIDILMIPAIGQGEILEILNQPVQAMDHGLLK